MVKKMDQNESQQTKRIEKPNLRDVDPYMRQKKFVIFGCFLVALYMYPTIIKPLFQIEPISEDESKNRKELLDKTRPSFMPEWSSPFARSRDED